MYQRYVCIGNLTRDPEVFYTQTGKTICKIRIGINSRKDESFFIDCVLWERTAELAQEHLKKGMPILFEGELRERHWEADGQRRSEVEMNVSHMRFIGGKGTWAGSTEGSAPESSTEGGTSDAEGLEPF